MKKQTLANIALAAFGLMAIAAMTVAPELYGLMFGSGAAIIAMAGAVVKDIDTTSTARQRVIPDYSGKLTELLPDVFPLDTALRSLKADEKAEDIEVFWEEVGQFPRVASVNGDVTATTGGAVMDIILTSGHASYFRKSDILRVTTSTFGSATNYADTKYLFVTAVNEATHTISVRAYDSTGYLAAAPALTSGWKVIRMSNAKSEKEGVGDPRSMQPVILSNLVQTFEKVIAIGKMRKKLRTYTEKDDVRAIRQALYDYRMDLEYAFWFGKKINTTHPITGDKIYKMAGVTTFVTTNLVSLPGAGSITEQHLMDWGKQVFADNNGSNERMFFVSPTLMNELAKINLVANTLRTNRSESVLGCTVDRIRTPFGDFLLTLHKGFPELGYDRYGACLDLQHIRRRVLEPMYRMDMKYEENGGLRVDAKKMLETSTVEVRYEKTHAIFS
jgi:hypothetical protein